MKQTVNYIKHLQCWSDIICCDDRLTPHHISMYYALFHQWNLIKFKNPISICRSELMHACKIGSANTYTKCLKQLHNWGYLEYKPSYNPARGSLVNLYNFDNSCNNSSIQGTDKSNAIDVRPSLNSINNNKQSKPNKQKREKSTFSPPAIDEVKIFFVALQSSNSEAENFYNYFESNGWLVGGKAKMKNWKAAAKNWIKRSANFNQTPSKNNSNGNYLNVNEDKDYSVPL